VVLQMVLFLLPMLEDKQPLVRSITCWTLSRYSRWVLQVRVRPPEGRTSFEWLEQCSNFDLSVLGQLMMKRSEVMSARKDFCMPLLLTEPQWAGTIQFAA
jgi:hypothetical protein